MAEPAEKGSAPEALPAGDYPPLRGMQLFLLTFAIGVSSFMEILDMTIVNVSIPTIAIPLLDVPPDILGGSIVTLGNKAFNGQVMQTAGQDGKHTYNLAFTQL